jgi:hypothetical protein
VALLDRFDPLRMCGTGSEAEVWQARRREDGREVAVKLHFPGKPVDMDLLTHLALEEFRRHVPEIVQFGRVPTEGGQRVWVALEFLPRTLTDLMAEDWAPGQPAPPDRAKELVAELAAAIHFWQERIQRNPIDFKPDNLMVRPGHPLQIVIADFGGVAAFTASQQVGPATATLAYMPPENIWHDKRTPWPWWGLGEIAFELATGHARFRRADGSLLPDQVIQRGRVLGALDLEAIADERWRLLVSGLLTRSPDDRWTWPQVREWLDGGSPEVVEERPQGDRPIHTHRPITFADGHTYHDPAKLAEVMLNQWDRAADWLAGDGRQRLLDWLREQVKDFRFDTGHLYGLAGKPDRAHLAVTAFGASFAPALTPRYRGQVVDAEGLLEAVGGPNGFAFAREVVHDNVLAIAAQYRCAHPECAGGERCTVLDRVAHDVPEVVRGVEEAVARVGRGLGEAGDDGAWQPLSQFELDRAHGLAMMLTLRPEQRGTITRDLGPPWRRPGWWRPIRRAALRADPATVTGRVSLIAAAILDGRAASAPRPRRRPPAAGTPARAERRTPSWQPLVSGVAAAVVGMALLAWAGAVMQQAIAAHTNDIGPLGGRIGAAAARQQVQLLPVLLVIAIEAVAVSRGRRGVVIVAGLGCGALGYLAGRLPAFTLFSLPTGIGDTLVRLGGSWHSAVGAIAAAQALGGLLLCNLAASLATRGGLGRVGAGRAGRAAPARGAQRLALAPVMLAVLLAALWMAETVRMTLASGGTLAGARIGLLAARDQSELLLVLAAVALIASVGAAGGGHGLFGWGVAGAVAIGLWAHPIPALDVLRRPVAEVELLGIAGWWGNGAFWAALLCYLPLVAAATQLLYERLRRA